MLLMKGVYGNVSIEKAEGIADRVRGLNRDAVGVIYESP